MPNELSMSVKNDPKNECLIGESHADHDRIISELQAKLDSTAPSGGLAPRKLGDFILKLKDENERLDMENTRLTFEVERLKEERNGLLEKLSHVRQKIQEHMLKAHKKAR